MDETSRGGAFAARHPQTWRRPACWLAAAFAVGVPLSAAIAQGGAGKTPLRAARPSEVAVLDVPAGVDLKVTGGKLQFDVASREVTISGMSELTFTNGVRLTAPAAKVRVVSAEKNGPHRIFVEP